MSKKFVMADEAPCFPLVKGTTPCGSWVLVEILTPKELMGTMLEVSEKTDSKIPLQGYVRAIGPILASTAVDGVTSWGFKIGDRVLISGNGVMAPNHDGIHRDRFLLEPTAIKAVLSE